MSAPALTFPHDTPRRRATPEIYFDKQIDNSRLVKVRDKERSREMAMFGLAVTVLLFFGMLYTWQHFRSIEYGYQIEQATAERDRLAEMNRALRLEEASLRDPSRIDVLARRMGMHSPQPGQVLRMETSFEPAGAVMASATAISVVAAPH